MRPAEGLIATLAALFVLFTALLDPRASFILAAILLIVLVTATAMRHRRRKRG